MYCNYSKDKFGNELTFIIPSWLDIPEGKITIKSEIRGESHPVRTFIDNDGLPTTVWESGPNIQEGGYYSNDIFVSGDWSDEKWLFIRSLEKSEDDYRTMLSKGWTPQQARQVLPNALKTEIVMTGFASDWKHFFDLRLFGTTGKPHPDMLLLAEKAKKVLDENNLWLLIYNQNDKT